MTAGNERTTLVRKTERLQSTLTVTVQNTGDRLIEPPFHAVLTFTPEAGGTLQGLVVEDVLGGIGADPYQTFYKDLSAVIGDGLAAGGEVRFDLAFSRPRTSAPSYRVELRGIRNGDPVALTGGPYSGQQGAVIAFDGSASSDPDGDPLSFEWDFGDGGTATGERAEHAYEVPGLYSATLTVRDGRGGEATREIQVPVVPPGEFALARTRTLDGAGHPLGGVTISQAGADGTHSVTSDPLSGFASLGGQEGGHTWTFESPGHLTVFRRAELLAGQVRVLPFPWLSALESERVTLSVLNATTVNSRSGKVSLVVPPEAFGQVESIAVTELHGQSLPLPLPPGWSPLVAFHLDLPAVAEADIATSLQLAEPVSGGDTLARVWLDTEEVAWKVEALPVGNNSERLKVFLRKPGSYAVVVADTLPDGNPGAPEKGTVLPSGSAPLVAQEVVAAGSVDPGSRSASRDPDLVTAAATVDFTNATQPLASGAWFLAAVEEIYDLRDGQALKAPDYDATFYAYQRPGDEAAATVAARFPLRPRILFGPDELSEARIRVDVLRLGQFNGGVIGSGGGLLSLAGVQVGIPAGAVAELSAAEIRQLSAAGLSRFLGEFSAILAFELNLPPLADGTALDFLITKKLPANGQFVLARCVTAGSSSGLQPLGRFRSDALGRVSDAEPTTGPRLPGITGSGQFVLVQLGDAQGLVTGLARQAGAAPLPGALARVTGEPWLSVTGADGRFATLSRPGDITVTAVDPASLDSGQADTDLADAADHADVVIDVAPSGPRVVSTTPDHEAVQVSAVTPVTVVFSEPIAPASLGADGVTLSKEGETTAVPAALSLSNAGTAASLFPANPLEAGATYTIAVAATITDISGRLLEGQAIFRFTVAPLANRGEGGQLVIYEPGGAGPTPEHRELLDAIPGYEPGADKEKVVAIGSAGTADPAVPVILVNESTGATATVLSKPDGSFANFIGATEEDFISAVFVNTNGTRVSIPASRQLFDDGRVGLYNGGGILEAENLQPDSAGARIEVLIEAESIPDRTVFRLESASPAALQQLLASNPPESGSIAGAFRYVVTAGEEPTIPPVVVFPATLAQLGLTDEDDPAEHTFALCQTDSLGGIPFYSIIDRMKYEDGKLITSSPPFPGLASGALSNILMVPLRMAFGTRFTVTGRVLAARASDLPLGGQVSEDEVQQLTLANGAPLFPVPGALVFGSSGGNNNTSNRLRPGAFTAKANTRGFYATVVPYNPISPDVILLSSAHPALPNISAFGGIVPDPQDSVALPVGRKHLVFKLPDNVAADFTSPVVQADPGQAVLPVGEPFVLSVRVEDSVSKPQLTAAAFDPAQSQADDSGSVLSPSSLEVVVGDSMDDGPKAVVVQVRLRAFEPMLASLLLTAVDQAGNVRTRVLFLRFGEPQPPQEELELVDDGDTTGPMLSGSTPGNGIPLSNDSIALVFTEPLSQSCLDAPAIIATGASIARRQLSRDQRTLTLTLSGLTKPVSSNDSIAAPLGISISLSPSLITDLAGNSLVGANMLTFPQLPERAFDLDQTAGAVAVTMAGNCVATLRNLNNEGRLMLHAVGAGAGTAPLGSALTPAFPRAMVYMPSVTYFLPDKSPPPFTTLAAGQNPLTLPGQIRTADLIAVTGGLVGDGQLGPWLRLIDIGDPANPVRLATSLVSGDFTSTASILKWSPPRLLAGTFTAEGSQVLAVNVQGFLIGSQGFSRGQYGFGIDLNLDGDFVDLGERPPVPKHRTLFGLEDISLPPDGLSINDFDGLGGGATLVAVTRSTGPRPAQLHVMRAPGVVLNAGEGILDLPDGTYRVLLDTAFPLEDESGARPILAALLTAKNQLFVVSLIDPQHPAIVRQHTVAAPGATVFSLAETSREELVVAATDGMRTISRSALGRLSPTPADRELIAELVLAGGRSIGASNEGFATFSSGGGTRLLLRRPSIGIVQFPSGPVRSVTDIVSLPIEEREVLFRRATERGFLLPAFFPDGGTGLSPLDPPQAEAHHYLLVRASGGFGSQIRVGVQSLSEEEAAAEMPPCPLPILPGEHAPNLVHFNARRLSEDSKSPLYNQFLAGPFVIVNQPLSQDQETAVAGVGGRAVLWGGEEVRSFIAADPLAPLDLFAFMADEGGGQIKPKVSATYHSFRPDYIDSPNPSLRLAPRLMGGLVDLQGGEITIPETDVAVEGRHQDLVFRRLYQSRSIYSGVLGRNWDHNFNARVQEFTEGDFPASFSSLWQDRGFDTLTARSGDLLLTDGAGTTHLFRKIGTAHGNEVKLSEYQNDPALTEFWGLGFADKIRTFYESPEGVFSIVVQLRDLKWVLIGTQGHRTYFNPNGTLDRLVGARSASVLTCHYRSGDGLLGEVRGDNSGRLRFGYYYPFLDPRRTGPIDLVSDDPLKCGRLAVVHGQLSAGPGGQRVEFDYDEVGNLETATPSWRRAIVYGYDQNNPRLLTRFGEQDSTIYPSATIDYVNGMVKSIETGGEFLEAVGSVATTKQRFQTGPSTVSLGTPGEPGASISIDDRGRPTAFGGRAMAADSEGQLRSFESLTRARSLIYDTANPVRRFRGNLIRTERRALNGGPPIVSKTAYDGGAFNRPVLITDPNGVETVLDHSPGEETATVGNQFVRQTITNAFGQKTAENRSGGPITLTSNFGLDPVNDLPSSTTSAAITASVARDDIGRISENRQGNTGNSHAYFPQTGQLRALVPIAPAVQPELGWTYDLDGRPETQTLSSGGKLLRHHFTYDDDQPGQASEVRVTESGLPDTVTGNVFDASGRLVSSDVDGIPSTYGYVGPILTSLTTPGLSRSLTLVNGADVASITENGVTTDFGYDASGRVLTVQTAGKRTTLLYEPGAAGTAGERLAGKVISAPLEALPPPEITEGYSYDTAGHLESITASNGRVRRFEYHSNGALHRAIINGQVVRQIDLQQNGQVTAVTLGNLRRVLSAYDPTSGRPQTETIAWTDSGQSLSVNYGYDAAGRVLTTTYPSGTYTSTYDAFGNITSRADPDGVRLTYEWSPSGIPVDCHLADGSLVSYSVGPGRRREGTHAASGSQQLGYTDNRLSSITQPDGTVLTFSDYGEFQTAGFATSGSVAQSLGYDGRGRLVSIESATEDTAWERSFDVLGRALGSGLGDEGTRFLYNAFDTLSGEITLSAGVELGRWSLARDVLDRTISETYPSGLVLSFDPDGFGQPTAVASTGIESVQWHGLGMPAEVRFDSGLKVKWSYDASFRTEKIEYVPTAGAVSGFTYEFTPGGRVLGETRLHEGRRDEFVRNAPSEAMRVVDFNLGLLVDAAPGPPPAPQAFVRGIEFVNGELTGPTTTSAASPIAGDARGFFPALERQQGSNRLAAVDGVAVTHNDRGSMDSFPVWIRLPGGGSLVRVVVDATWDGVGNLVRIERDDGVVVNYTRDGQGRIAVREVAGPAGRCIPSTTRYFWAGERLLEERDATTPALGLLRRYHYLGGRLMLMEVARTGGGMDRLIPLAGLNGSVGGYLNEAGTLLHTIHYGPYGLPVPPVGDDGIGSAAAASPIQFHGSFFDSATGLYEMGERHLHPLTGGFLERDAELFVESLAWFSAFNGDPVGRVDPFGRLSDTVDSLASLVALANKGQSLYKAATGVHRGTYSGEDDEEEKGHSARVKSGIDLVTGGIDLYLTNQDDDARARWKGITDKLGKAKEVVEKLEDLKEVIGGGDDDAADEAEGEAQPWSSEARWGWLKEPGEMLMFPSLSEGGMEMKSKGLQTFTNTKLARAGMPEAPEFEDVYGDAVDARLKSIGRVKTGFALAKAGLEFINPEFLQDPHNKMTVEHAFATLNSGLSVAEKLAALRGERALVALRANPIEALSQAFDFGFELGKLAIIALSDADVAKAYEAQVKQFEDDGGLLTVGAGILSTLGDDETAFLIRRIADTEIDVIGSFQTVFENALNERERRQNLTEYYLRGISAP